MNAFQSIRLSALLYKNGEAQNIRAQRSEAKKEKVKDLKAGRKAARQGGRSIKAVKKEMRTNSKTRLARVSKENTSRPLVYPNVQMAERVRGEIRWRNKTVVRL